MASIVRTQNTMYFLVLPLLLHCSVAFPVFTFNDTSTSQETLSYAYLAKEVPLPDIFTLCTSVKQARFDGNRFFSIIGKDSRDWMLMRFKTFSNETKLTLNLGEDHRYHILEALRNPRLDFWYHICVRINLGKNEIEVAINGEPMGQVFDINTTNKPSKFKMKIGVDYYKNEQFQGSMSNIQVFSDGNVTKLSSSRCTSKQNALLPWNPSVWKVVGSDWSLAEEFDDMICNASDNYMLAIQSMLTFQESIDICKNKLKSIIPFQEDREQFLRYVAWHKNITKGACSDIWTPFSDEHSEGSFLNMNSLSEAHPQYWEREEPNGGKNENSVAIRVSTASLVDAPQTSLKCSSCLISSSLLLQLDGRCRHSLMGKVIAC